MSSSWRGLEGRLTAYADPGLSSFLRRAFIASAGYDQTDLNRPVVAVIDTSSDYTTCHRDMPSVVSAVRRGVLQGGALPLTLPTLSLGEIFMNPTSMLYRNLLAMETEEALTAYPLDAAVLIGGCDKTVPAQLMAAASANIPVLSVVTGPMRTGFWRDRRLGACTDCRSHWLQFRAGQLSQTEIEEVQEELCPTSGTCMVMGTASTMACLSEVLGMMLPGGATSPSGSGERLRHAVASGRRAAELAKKPLRPSDILTKPAFNNAITTLLAIGGSTNAIIHLIAIARRAGIPLPLSTFEEASRRVPLIVNCKPSGELWLEDLHRAGGLQAVLKRIYSLLETRAIGVSGLTIEQQLSSSSENTANLSIAIDGNPVIGTLADPIGTTGSLTVLYGSLAPNGAILKKSAATPNLLQHRGPAIVFDSPEDLANRLDDPDLQVSIDSVLVLRNCGPVAAGMPETGSFPIPKKLAERGVLDMVRVSDARMSGTAGGTVVLHCSPESASGGPLSLVQDGDLIELDADNSRIDLLVSSSELAKRQINLKKSPKQKLPARGWPLLHARHVLPAHLGADLDFLGPNETLPESD